MRGDHLRLEGLEAEDSAEHDGDCDKHAAAYLRGRYFALLDCRLLGSVSRRCQRCLLARSIPATMGNFILPMMIWRAGRRVSASQSPVRQSHVVVAAFTVYVLLTGGVDTGWTFYPPFSSSYSHSGLVAAAVGVFVVGFSSVATGVDFLATVHLLRAPGMTWFRLPLFVWSMYVVSMMMVLATPVLAMWLAQLYWASRRIGEA